MKAIKFKGANDKFGDNLPAYKNSADKLAQVVTCYKLGFFEWLKLFFTGRKIYSSVVTQGENLQPQRLTSYNPVQEVETEVNFMNTYKR